ncbi:hypothetical protein BJV78DRAFT_820553 [Lactifluus subvellereus]|nr:hypothetical protein BJV78DRAFT_820553 [Lactifluus subvellereus]
MINVALSSGFACFWKTVMPEPVKIPTVTNEIARQFLVAHILSFVPYVVVWYDYFLTLSDEIDLFWTRRGRFSLFPFFFFLNRYVSLAGDLPIVVFGVIGGTSFMVRVPAGPAVHCWHLDPHNAVTAPLQSCKTSRLYHMVLQLIQQSIVAGAYTPFSASRRSPRHHYILALCVMQIDAIYKSRWVLALLMLIIVVGAAVASWSIYLLVAQHRPYFMVSSTFLGCRRPLSDTEGFYSAISWTGALVLDTSVFLLLLWKAVTIGRGVRLYNVIMRNGTIYYTILSLVNLSNILVLRFATPALKTSMTSLANALAPTLISRLILNLRAESTRTAIQSPEATTQNG